MSRSSPAAVSSSRAIASASRRMSRRSRGHLADDADAEARAREGVAPDDLGGQAELLADQADLVLEQGAQRLDELELQVLGQAADVVVGLDVGGARAAAGLDDVGVERALDEELDLLALLGRLADDLGLGGLEDPDELAADDLALLLGVGDAGERVEEALGGVDDVRGRRRWRRRSRARPARPRPCAAGRGRRRRRSAGRRWPAGPARPRPRSRRRRTARRSRARRRPGRGSRSTCSSTMLTIVQVGPAAGDRRAGSAQHLPGRARSAAPRGATGRRRGRRSRSSNAATGEPPVAASTEKPSGAATTESPWLIHTRCSAGSSASSVPGAVTSTGGAAVLPGPGRGDLAAERLGHQPGSRSTCRTRGPRR